MQKNSRLSHSEYATAVYPAVRDAAGFNGVANARSVPASLGEGERALAAAAWKRRRAPYTASCCSRYRRWYKPPSSCISSSCVPVSAMRP